jgi:hypothetical protein
MDNVEIKNGTITYKGEIVGVAMKAYKHGYHPSIRVTLYKEKKSEWFELDEKNLVEKIKEYVLSKV